MSDQLPFIVLVAGSAVGVVLAVLALRGRQSRGISALQRRDLELQLEELYAELRKSDLPETDRRALEERAAKTLRELGSTPRVEQLTEETPATTESITRPRPTGGFTSRHPLLAGVLLGGGMVALIAVLVALAFRDTGIAEIDPDSANSRDAELATTGAAGMTSAGPESGGDGNFRGEPALPPQVATQVADLRDRLSASEGDLSTRRQLIELLLAHEQHFDAFQQANVLLEQDPRDPVGHYASGFVRFVMGQVDPALEHLAQAVESDPGYIQAWLVQGLIQLQIGARDAAIDSWSQGLEASGGTDTRLQHLLDLTRQGLSFQEVISQPPP